MKSTPEALLRDLINISSVSSESNVPVIRYAQDYLSTIGWQWEEQPYTDERGTPKLNLIAWPNDRPPLNGACELAFLCHTDTVPYDWPEAVQPILRDGNLFGRGACDVKGFLASALAALPDLHGSVCLLLTADEEVGCIGVQRLVDSGVIRPRHAIIGEPTGLRPVRAGKGYCLAKVRTHGREAHSAFPDRGESAIFKAGAAIRQIERIAAELKAEQNPEFDPPYTTVNIGIIQGGRAKNVVAAECSMVLEWRPIPGQDVKRVPAAITEGAVEILRLQSGFQTPESHPFIAQVVEIAGKSAGVVSFGTEAPALSRLGTVPIVFGPGDMRVAHSRNEHVSTEEIDTCKTLLVLISLAISRGYH